MFKTTSIGLLIVCLIVFIFAIAVLSSEFVPRNFMFGSSDWKSTMGKIVTGFAAIGTLVFAGFIIDDESRAQLLREQGLKIE